MKFSTLLLLAVFFFPFPRVQGALALDELIDRLKARNSETVSIRAKLTVTDTASGVRNAAQILIKQRCAEGNRNLLYQVLWPPSRKGEALCLEKSNAGVTTGFSFEPPDKVIRFEPAHSEGAYLDSNLSIEDVTEDFWQWPSQKLAGEESLNGEVCQIVESSPPAGVHSSYSLIRTWVAPAKIVPLRMDKFGRDGRLAKRFIVSKVARHDKLWMPMTTLIEVPGGTRQTTFEISRGDRSGQIPLSDFSLENIKQFPRPGGAKSGKHE